MYILNSALFREAVKKKGYRSIGELAQSLGIHRNTIHHYLSGHRVMPENLEKVLRALDLEPSAVLVDRGEAARLPYEAVAPVVDRLHAEFPQVSFILFGSRVQGRARRHSDWDIGVYSLDGISHELYRRMVRRKDDLIDELPLLVDLANLNRADFDFLSSISKGWIFLAGRQQDWLDLQKKVFT